MPLILEGLVTTLGPGGEPHLAPMGPAVDREVNTLLLRPFPSSQTYQNLLKFPEGVFHVTDDAAMIARAAVGECPMPPLLPATAVQGNVIASACRAYEFRVTSIDTSEQRVRMTAEVVAATWGREFFGFNRAKHAVVEAAILATRFAMLAPTEVERQFRELAVIVGKTGGPDEIDAMAFLQAKFDEYRGRS